MSLQFSTTVRNAMLDSLETAVGTSAVMKLFTGAPPATCATANSGTLLASASLPSDWMAAASSGSKALAGTWEDSSVDANGRAAHFRIYASDGTTCHSQGLVAMAWIASTAYSVGDYVTNDSGKLYVCDTAGTSAASGGPTGTTANITDGTAQWDYVQAAADMAINNAVLAIGQVFSVTTFTLTAPGA